MSPTARPCPRLPAPLFMAPLCTCAHATAGDVRVKTKPKISLEEMEKHNLLIISPQKRGVEAPLSTTKTTNHVIMTSSTCDKTLRLHKYHSTGSIKIVSKTHSSSERGKKQSHRCGLCPIFIKTLLDILFWKIVQPIPSDCEV